MKTPRYKYFVRYADNSTDVTMLYAVIPGTDISYFWAAGWTYSGLPHSYLTRSSFYHPIAFRDVKDLFPGVTPCKRTERLPVTVTD